MGVKFSQLPELFTDVADNDYVALLDTSDAIVKKTKTENFLAKQQPKELENPIVVDDVYRNTVETALSALAAKANMIQFELD